MVVGGGSIGPGWGNGKAISVRFAREGCRVVAIDQNLDAAEETSRLIGAEGGQCLALRADVAVPDQVENVIGEAYDRLGAIDILVNNVGIVSVGGPAELSVEEWDRVAAINERSVFLATKYAIPHMERQGSGVIINISSIAAIRWTGVPYSTYYATKAAIIGFSRGVALQYAKVGIRSVCILPGLMDTPMVHAGLTGAYGTEGDHEGLISVRNAQCPTGRMGDAWDVANAALFLASDEGRYITGTELIVDGGLTAKFA